MRRRAARSVAPGRVAGEYEVLHLRVGLLLARLAEEDHHHDPLGLLDVDLVVVERQEPIDYELALHGLQDANVLEMEQIAAGTRVEPFLLVVAVESNRRGARSAARDFGRVQPVEPIERAVDLTITEAGAFQF